MLEKQWNRKGDWVRFEAGAIAMKGARRHHIHCESNQHAEACSHILRSKNEANLRHRRLYFFKWGAHPQEDYPKLKNSPF